MSTRVSRKLRRVSNTLVQATLGVVSVNFWSFTVAWTSGGGGCIPLCTMVFPEGAGGRGGVLIKGL